MKTASKAFWILWFLFCLLCVSPLLIETFYAQDIDSTAGTKARRLAKPDAQHQCYGVDGEAGYYTCPPLIGGTSNLSEDSLVLIGPKDGQCAKIVSYGGIKRFESTPCPIDPAKYILVYQTDLGCLGDSFYPEGGCQHVTAAITREFDSADEALKFVNDQCSVERPEPPRQDSNKGGNFLVSNFNPLGSLDCSKSATIELYQAQRLDLKKVVTGHYKATESRQVEVTKDKTEWQLKK